MVPVLSKAERTGGFTLIELLVVVAIIGLLASVVLSAVNTARAKAKDAKRLADINAVEVALQEYAIDNNGTYPGGQNCNQSGNWGCFNTSLQALVTDKYLPSLPQDPLVTNLSQDANNYHYCANGSGNGTSYMIMIKTESMGHPSWCIPPGIPVSFDACTWKEQYPSCLGS